MNFTYLKAINLPRGLYEACREAELFAKTFPTASLSSARRAGEFTVKMMYGALIDEQSAFNKTTFDMLSELRNDSHINDIRWFDAAHNVRRSGNVATHQGEGNVQDSLTVLAYLYDEIGIALKQLGLIHDYPPFDLSLVPDTTDEPVPKTEIEIELTKEFLAKIHPSRIRRTYVSEHPQVYEKHKDPAANSRTALVDVTCYLLDRKPQWTIHNEPLQGVVIISNSSGKTLTMAVKSGCPPLGKRVNGVMELLPGIDYVAYAPFFSMEKTYSEQLRVISKEDFLSMWYRLGLVRTKITTATYKRLKLELPPDAIISQEAYADSITVQSFLNSGKKTKLLNEELEKMPLLSQEGLSIIEAALMEK